MRIRRVRHKGLRRLLERGDVSGLPPHAVDKLRNMMAFLQDMASEDELYSIPVWKAHRLSGDRSGSWSLFVTKNWRLTFEMDSSGIEIIDLDFEDYH